MVFTFCLWSNWGFGVLLRDISTWISQGWRTVYSMRHHAHRLLHASVRMGKLNNLPIRTLMTFHTLWSRQQLKVK